MYEFLKLCRTAIALALIDLYRDAKPAERFEFFIMWSLQLAVTISTLRLVWAGVHLEPLFYACMLGIFLQTINIQHQVLARIARRCDDDQTCPQTTQQEK